MPLAQQLGITEYRRDLEILAFKILYPYRYNILKNTMDEYTEKNKKVFQNIIQMISKQGRHAVQNTDAIIGRKKASTVFTKKCVRRTLSF